METATFVIALFGAVTGAAALAWNVLEFALSGHRISVRLSKGVRMFFDAAHDPEWTLAANVSNRGRQGASIVGLELVVTTDSGAPRFTSCAWHGPGFPHRVDGQAETRWDYGSLQHIADALDSIRGVEPRLWLHATAKLPGDRKVMSNRIELPREMPSVYVAMAEAGESSAADAEQVRNDQQSRSA